MGVIYGDLPLNRMHLVRIDCDECEEHSMSYPCGIHTTMEMAERIRRFDAEARGWSFTHMLNGKCRTLCRACTRRLHASLGGV